MEIVLDNFYFDLNAIENPIKNYFRTEVLHFISAEIASGLNIYIRRNTYSIRDSIWPSFWTNEKEGVFYSIERVEKYSRDKGSNEVFQIQIIQDSQTDHYTMRILNLLEVTGTLGGVFELLSIAVGFIMGIYSSYSLNLEIKERFIVKEKEVQDKLFANQNNKHLNNEYNKDADEINEGGRIEESKEKINSNNNF
mmetsp:Transcript_23816/g.21158  ORF Transcript_23816/g.21158 Transcript_23816/m.21158 type:complete len:195 (-) Transcript_23816:495-1079(-)